MQELFLKNSSLVSDKSFVLTAVAGLWPQLEPGFSTLFSFCAYSTILDFN